MQPPSDRTDYDALRTFADRAPGAGRVEAHVDEEPSQRQRAPRRGSGVLDRVVIGAAYAIQWLRSRVSRNMPAGAETAGAADRVREREHALRLVADRLREVLPRVPSSYKAGRSALLKALVGLDDLTPAQAGRLLTELTELGVIKYTTEGRGIGAAGMWTYARAATSRPKTAPPRPRRRA